DGAVARTLEPLGDGTPGGGVYQPPPGPVLSAEAISPRSGAAPKLALAALVAHLESAGFGLIDCQMRTRHLETLGAREIPRRRFSRLLQELIHYPHSPGSWSGASVAQVQCRS